MAAPKSFSESSYAVHPLSDAGPSSSPHPGAEEYDHRASSPPPYSSPTTPSMTAPRPTPAPKHYPGLPKLEYKLYSPQPFALSKDQTTLSTSQSRLSTKPQELISLIQLLATVPPKPQIWIRGGKDGRVHFELKLNMMNLIVPDESKLRMNYVRVIGAGEKGWRGEIKETTTPTVTGGLEEWARMFCQNPAAIKQFTLERTVTNWDTSYLEGLLLSLISSTSYRGHTTITFPLTHSHVTVHSPDKVNRFFSNVTSLFTGVNKYEVVKSVWPYANVERGEEGRRCAVQSEDVWFNEWKDSIRHAVLAQRKGWVTTEDRLEFLMELRNDEFSKPEEWGSY